MSAQRYNVRMAGIGGQGVVTASHILSNGVVISGGYSSLVPFFGSEKRMRLLKAMSGSPIRRSTKSAKSYIQT